jgi:hypothetical protein
MAREGCELEDFPSWAVLTPLGSDRPGGPAHERIDNRVNTSGLGLRRERARSLLGEIGRHDCEETDEEFGLPSGSDAHDDVATSTNLWAAATQVSADGKTSVAEP